MTTNVQNWLFKDKSGTFLLKNPHHTSGLYFPLVNEAGLMSCITPSLHGDIKTGQNSFLTPPVSIEDLHNSRAARNFWVYLEGYGPWSAGGNSAAQIALRFNPQEKEAVTLEAGFLWHRLERVSPNAGIRATITSFAPCGEDPVELTKITLTNLTQKSIQLTPTAAVPLYGRSADNLRDHRHVTSLLQRVTTGKYGVLVKPTLSFDERGHTVNTLTYAVLGMEADGTAPAGFFPEIGEFTGEGGSLEWPRAVVENLPPGCRAGATTEGYEALGGLRFGEICLEPGTSHSYILILGILDEGKAISPWLEAYGNEERFDRELVRCQGDWQAKLQPLEFHSGDEQFNSWMKWVSLQPILRRLYGNSFLPYHDYGRGGRGWRDLWQDCLALLLVEPDEVPELLYNNYAGVRLDGSNATIIGTGAGEFKADRNNIPRVWMDHGAWPFLTTLQYLDQSGDLSFLLREQAYFKDSLAHQARRRDPAWQVDQGTQQLTARGDVYYGTLLEHILVEHLVAFFNVGEHNNLKLEGADWNDALDMAPHRGESVAFSALYAGNLDEIARIVEELDLRGIHTVELAAELGLLLDTLDHPQDYDDVQAKQDLLEQYFCLVEQAISGEKRRVEARDLAGDLRRKAGWLKNHICTQEWVQLKDGSGWFNGYYDDDGQRVEGEHPLGVRMTLTGQVFTLMAGIATPEQAVKAVEAADRYLFDPAAGGYRLNTNFGEALLNLGRGFGFAYGHKENGAVFSHMAVMYANALYRCGFSRQGYQALDSLYRQCMNFNASRMYPGIPEYFDPKGRGLYPYLTGSASWLMLTLLQEAYGVRGRLGDLTFEPHLCREQFSPQGEAGVSARFAGRKLEISYHNSGLLDAGEYHITAVYLDGAPTSFFRQGEAALLRRETILALDDQKNHRIDIELGSGL